MAHFAELDDNNVVLRVIVVSNDVIVDANGQEDEALGIAFCHDTFGGNWKQTSYNGSFRRRYAGIGFTYDANLDAFIPPKPYPSWVFNSTEADWVAPIPYPDNGQIYIWDEATQSWVPDGPVD